MGPSGEPAARCEPACALRPRDLQRFRAVPARLDFAFAKKTQAKIILVADDAGPSMRASGVPVVRMQAMSSDAMAKKLFLDLDWPAEEAVATARAAKGDMLRQGRLPRRRATLLCCQPTAKRHRARELSARSLCRCVDRAQPRTALRKYRRHGGAGDDGSSVDLPIRRGYPHRRGIVQAGGSAEHEARAVPAQSLHGPVPERRKHR